ncbi:MAG: hypothetical protein MHM6MM_001130 [Cercozoa sp. M6MM]
MVSETDKERAVKKGADAGEKEGSAKTKDANKKDTHETELSEADQHLKELLDSAVAKVLSGDDTRGLDGVRTMKHEISTSTTTMTSVPKPLKFLHPHFDELSEHFRTTQTNSDELKGELANVLSVLSLTREGTPEELSVLRFKLLAAPLEIGFWGHEYVRHLTGEIVECYQGNVEEEEDGAKQIARFDGFDDIDLSKLQSLITQILEYEAANNGVAEMCDLTINTEQTDRLLDLCKENQYERMCHYLASCSPYMSDVEETEKLLQVVFALYIRFDDVPNALRVALKLDDSDRISKCLELSSQKGKVHEQVGFMLAQHRFKVRSLQMYEDEDDEEQMDFVELAGNARLSGEFRKFAKAMELDAPKNIDDDIYKMYLEEHGSKASRRGAKSGPTVDSAKENLAKTFVNAFVHAAHGKDALVTVSDTQWIFKTKTHGKISAAASLGLIHMFDTEGGFDEVDNYSNSDDPLVRAGAALGTGLVSTGITSAMDAAFGVLVEHITESEDATLRKQALLGLALAYAGSARKDIWESCLAPILFDLESNDEETVFYAALAAGMVFQGTCDVDACGALLAVLLEYQGEDSDENDGAMQDEDEDKKEDEDEEAADSKSKLQHPLARFLFLALGLLFMGVGERVDAMMEALEVLERPGTRRAAMLLLELCAYAGTGNVLEVQKMLSVAGEKAETSEKNEEEKDEDEESEDEELDGPQQLLQALGGGKLGGAKKDDEDQTHGADEFLSAQALATIGIALVSLGEELGAEMALRAFDNLLQYGDIRVRRAVPLALGLQSVSDPSVLVMDLLHKLSHDNDEYVSMHAILGLGLVGAGTQNSRLAKILRQLAGFYSRDANHLFCTRIAQGLLYMAKGLMTLSPLHSDGMLLSKTSLSGLLTVLIAALDAKHTILGSHHFLLYFLALAMRPRMLVTLDEETLEPVKASVRVGQAVDVVRQAGKPKTVTGFQTLDTPVLLSRGERAELATEEFIPYTKTLEGFVLLKKNPKYNADIAAAAQDE